MRGGGLAARPPRLYRWSSIRPSRRPVAEAQMRLVKDEVPTAIGQIRRERGSVRIRIDERRFIGSDEDAEASRIWREIRKALQSSPGESKVVAEIVLRRGVADLEFPDVRIDLTPALERELREIGCEVFVA